MKQLLFIISLSALYSAALTTGCEERQQPGEIICGGYTAQRELTDEDTVLFHKVLGEGCFLPLSVATQVVAGINYRFRCSYDGGHCLVTIWQTLQGPALLTSVCNEDGGPEKKVIIDENGVTGRYVKENETYYFGEIQDDWKVEKNKAHVETVKACEGGGWLYLNEPGEQTAFSRPDTSSVSVGTMKHVLGECPEAYRCLGYIKGWFLAEIDGKAGFVPEDMANWDAIVTF